MWPKNLKGNDTKLGLNQKIEPVYSTLTLTSKKESDEKSKDPVNPTLEMNAVLAKKYVDENHK